MQLILKTTLASLALLFLAQPVPAQACAVLGKEEAARRSQENLAQARAQALALKEEADTVFVGHLTNHRFTSDTVKDGAGRDILMQTHHARFDQVDSIKGSYAAGEPLTFSVNKTLVLVGCGPRPILDTWPLESGAIARYLVYAREGKILRSSRIPADIAVPDGFDEVQLLRSQP